MISGQVLVLFVIAVKKRQLLLAVGRVVEGIDVQRQDLGGSAKEAMNWSTNMSCKSEEALRLDGVLESREGGLAGQIVAIDRAAADQFEDRIATQHIVVVLVDVVGQDAVDPSPGHLQEAVAHVAGIAGIVQGLGELPGQSQLLIQLADRQQTGVAGNLVGRRLQSPPASSQGNPVTSAKSGCIIIFAPFWN